MAHAFSMEAILDEKKQKPEPAHKPRLRGVSHLIATLFALAGGYHLLVLAPPGVSAPVFVYAIGLVALFGVSAIYHKPLWSAEVRARLRRLDHSTIFIFIAATYTPICLLAIDGEAGRRILIAVWCCAAVGIVKSLFWPGAPRFLTASLYVAMGWLIVGSFSSLLGALGTGGTALLLAGGVLYTVGAILYALKWPEPIPGVFGHHEVFHALVIGAAICHFVVVRSLVLAAS